MQLLKNKQFEAARCLVQHGANVDFDFGGYKPCVLALVQGPSKTADYLCGATRVNVTSTESKEHHELGLEDALQLRIASQSLYKMTSEQFEAKALKAAKAWFTEMSQNAPCPLEEVHFVVKKDLVRNLPPSDRLRLMFLIRSKPDIPSEGRGFEFGRSFEFGRRLSK